MEYYLRPTIAAMVNTEKENVTLDFRSIGCVSAGYYKLLLAVLVKEGARDYLGCVELHKDSGERTDHIFSRPKPATEPKLSINLWEF